MTKAFSRRGALFGVSLAIVFSVQGVSAQADEDTSLRLVTSPLPINISAKPGTEVQAAIKIKNDGAKKETIDVSVLKFKAYEDTGKPQLLDPEEGDEFLKWVSFSEDPFTIEPQEWKTITATWKVPEGAAFSYYYGILFSRAQVGEAVSGGRTAIHGGSAILALLEAEVPGAKREISVSEFSADRKWYEFLPAEFTVKLRNDGNVHVAPRGNIFIRKHGDIETIGQLEVNLTKGNILPQTNRIFESAWDDGFPMYVQKVENGKAVLDGDGNHVYELKWDFRDVSKIRFGKYTANLFLVYSDSEKKDIPIEGEISFWVIPWRIILALLVVVVLVGIGVKSALQNLFRRVRGVFSRKK